uniref:Uncharacterized protein n=1 Tax=Romanomermis culicivorax TaxID=13658 RepID=A0A915IDD7_ROMCU
MVRKIDTALNDECLQMSLTNPSGDGEKYQRLANCSSIAAANDFRNGQNCFLYSGSYSGPCNFRNEQGAVSQVIQRIRKYKGQRASELNVGDPQQQRDRPQQTFPMSQAEENQRYKHQHEPQKQQKHLPDSAQSWNEEQRNDLHQNNNQYEHYSSGRLHDQDHSQALSTQSQNSVQNDASGLQPVLGRDSPYNQSHPERPPSPQPSNHQNQTSYSYRQSESARRLNKIRSPNKNDKTTPSPYTKYHSLPILVKIDAACFWSYDSSDKPPSKLCSPMNSIDVAFELESDRCRLKYNGLSYEAFVGNCETIDGMIGFNDRCKVVSYNSKRKDNKLFDECKRRWDLNKTKKGRNKTTKIRNIGATNKKIEDR